MQRKNKKTLQFSKTVGILIRKLRLDKTGLAGKAFAYQYDLNDGNLNRIENGLIEPKFVTVWQIAEALDMKFSEFAKLLEEELGADFKLIDE